VFPFEIMFMQAYRIEKDKYINTLLEGIPGKDFDFRWNTKGHPLIYAAESKSLALHEKAGNLSKPFFGLPTFYRIVTIELPGFDYGKILSTDLPAGWNKLDSYHQSTQNIGNEFSLSEELALFVPSTIVKGEYNVLINPRLAVKENLSVTVEPIDKRLLDSRS